jgi:hypothetical protein
MKTIAKIMVMFFVTLVMASTAMGEIIFVDANATGANDGSSWVDAFNYLQDALATAQYGDEIRAAQGIYKPDHGAGVVPGDREATFQLKNGVAIKGGYAGFGEPDANARDIKLYETLLCGDIGIVGDISDNCYHVVTGGGTDATSVLDGFTIFGGNANAGVYPYNYGGGMYNNRSSPTLTKCTFSKNCAERGGGMYNNSSSSVTLSNCIFSGNVAERYGGGFYNYQSYPTVTNCTFTGNLAHEQGGGINISCGRPILINCILWGNIAPIGSQISGTGTVLYSDVEGGWPGEGNIDADPRFAQPGYWVTPPFASEPNPSDGAMNVNLTADLSWTAGRDAVSHDVYFGISYPPPFIHNQTSTTFYPGTMTMGTTYFWRIDEFSNSGITAGDIWSFTTIMPPPPPPPSMPPPPPPGLPPSISATTYVSDNQKCIWIEGDYHLLPISPCIDAGDPDYVAGSNETDLDGNPRIISGRIDMGAYEHNPAIPAEVRISPSTINPESKGQWITASLWLPDGFNAADIDTNSILLEYAIEPKEFQVDESKQVVTARFSREEVQGILNPGEVELTISVQLMDGTLFDGSDIIRVTLKGGRGPDKNLQASVPNVTGVSITADLSWTAGSYAISHNVYFGTSNPPPFVCNQTATTFEPGTMDYEITYYWRIDEVNKWGVTAGELSSFTTIEAPSPPPPPPPVPPPIPPPPPPGP